MNENRTCPPCNQNCEQGDSCPVRQLEADSAAEDHGMEMLGWALVLALTAALCVVLW